VEVENMKKLGAEKFAT